MSIKIVINSFHPLDYEEALGGEHVKKAKDGFK